MNRRYHWQVRTSDPYQSGSHRFEAVRLQSLWYVISGKISTGSTQHHRRFVKKSGSQPLVVGDPQIVVKYCTQI